MERLFTTTPRQLMAILLSVLLVAAPALAAPVVVVEGDRLVVSGKVQFSSGDAAVDQTSENQALLRGLAKAIVDDGQIDRIVVEGHTDSAGNQGVNLALSRKRAAAVMAALVGLGVPLNKLESRGYGDTVPVATNDTPAGRERNRRVEFTILSRGGKPTAAASPLAHIAGRFNKVVARPPEEPSWSDGKVGTPLFRAWRVNTEQKSSADVAFQQSSRVHLRERTLIVIFGANNYEKKSQRRATLESGALVSRIDELLGGGPLTVESAAGEIDLGRGRAVVSTDKKVARVSNHGGDSVRVRGKTGKKPAEEPAVDVTEGMGTRVTKGKVPEPPRPLPPAPRMDAEQPASIRYDDDVSILAFGWTTEQPGESIVEIRQADGDQGEVFQARVDAGVHQVEARGLPPGVYTVSLSTVDEAGLESKPSTTTLTVGPKPTFVLTPEQRARLEAPTPAPTPATDVDTKGAAAPLGSTGGGAGGSAGGSVGAPGTAQPDGTGEAEGLCSTILCPIVIAGSVVLVVGAAITGIVLYGESAK